MNVLLIRAAGKAILVETGGGAKWDAKRRHIYGFSENDPLQEALAAKDIADAQIDLVINTHLHFDHAGGLGLLPESLPVIVQRREWEAGHDDGAVARNFFYPRDYAGRDLQRLPHSRKPDSRAVAVASRTHPRL